MSETAVPDPNGEDICGFGTHLTCRPFVWQTLSHEALSRPSAEITGRQSAINSRGQIVGMAEKTVMWTPHARLARLNNRIQLPVMWEKRQSPRSSYAGWRRQAGSQTGINDHGQAVGNTGNCGAMSHAVSWENDTVTELKDLGTGAGAIAYGNNNRGQIVGSVFVSPGGATSIWRALAEQRTPFTNLGTLPGDMSRRSHRHQRPGPSGGKHRDSNFNWSHAFIYQDGVMTNLNTLFPDSSNLPRNHG